MKKVNFKVCSVCNDLLSQAFVTFVSFSCKHVSQLVIFDVSKIWLILLQLFEAESELTGLCLILSNLILFDLILPNFI